MCRCMSAKPTDVPLPVGPAERPARGAHVRLGERRCSRATRLSSERARSALAAMGSRRKQARSPSSGRCPGGGRRRPRRASTLRLARKVDRSTAVDGPGQLRAAHRPRRRHAEQPATLVLGQEVPERRGLPEERGGGRSAPLVGSIAVAADADEAAGRGRAECEAGVGEVSRLDQPRSRGAAGALATRPSTAIRRRRGPDIRSSVGASAPN